MPKNIFPNYKCYPDDSIDSDPEDNVFPSTNKDAILSALDNLHSKIQNLDRERLEALSRLQLVLDKNESTKTGCHHLSNNLQLDHGVQGSRLDSVNKQRSNPLSCKSKNQSHNDSDFPRKSSRLNSKMDEFSSTIIRSANNLATDSNKHRNDALHRCADTDVMNSSSFKTLKEYRGGDVLNSTSRNCYDLKESNRDGPSIRGESLPIDDNCGSSLKFSKQNKSILNSDVGWKKNGGIPLKGDKSCINGKRALNDRISNRIINSDTFVTLAEASQGDISTRLQLAEQRCGHMMRRFEEMNNSFDSKYIHVGRANNPTSDKTKLDKLALLKAESERLHLNRISSDKKIEDLEQKILRDEITARNTLENSKCRNIRDSSLHSSASSDSDCAYKMASIPFIVQKKHGSKRCRGSHSKSDHLCSDEKSGNTTELFDGSKKYFGSEGFNKDGDCNGRSTDKSASVKSGGIKSRPNNKALSTDRETRDKQCNDASQFSSPPQGVRCSNGERRNSRDADGPTRGRDVKEGKCETKPVDEIGDFDWSDGDTLNNPIGLDTVEKLERIIRGLEVELNDLFCLREAGKEGYLSVVQKWEESLVDMAQQIDLKMLQISIVRQHIVRVNRIASNCD